MSTTLPVVGTLFHENHTENLESSQKLESCPPPASAATPSPQLDREKGEIPDTYLGFSREQHEDLRFYLALNSTKKSTVDCREVHRRTLFGSIHTKSCDSALCFCGIGKQAENKRWLRRVAQSAPHLISLMLSVPNTAALVESYAHLAYGLSSLQKPIERAKKKYNLLHYARATEVTYSAVDGTWHPHAHMLLIFSEESTTEQRTACAEYLRDTFLRFVNSVGCEAKAGPKDFRNIPSDPRSRRTAGAYLAKQSILPTSTDSGHLYIGDVLRRAATGEQRYRELWTELETVTKGKHPLTKSRGLEEEFGLKKSDVTPAA